MEIDIKTFIKLTGITANDTLLSERLIRRKQERKLRKKLAGKMTAEEIKNIAKIHPVGDVEVINLNN
jgi:ribosomal protein L11